jgi:hypothetical protein
MSASWQQLALCACHNVYLCLHHYHSNTLSSTRSSIFFNRVNQEANSTAAKQPQSNSTHAQPSISKQEEWTMLLAKAFAARKCGFCHWHAVYGKSVCIMHTGLHLRMTTDTATMGRSPPLKSQYVNATFLATPGPLMYFLATKLRRQTL